MLTPRDLRKEELAQRTEVACGCLHRNCALMCRLLSLVTQFPWLGRGSPAAFSSVLGLSRAGHRAGPGPSMSARGGVSWREGTWPVSVVLARG